MEKNKEIINEILTPVMGFNLFDEDNSINVATIKENCFPNREEIEINENSDVCIEKTEGKDVEFEWDYNVLKVYVPEEIQKKIEFSVEYVFSLFDKINNNINSISKQLNDMGITEVENAERLLKIFEGKSEYDENQKTLILMRMYGVENSMGNFEKRIKETIDEINKIPTNRLFRVQRTNIKQILGQEKIAHIDLLMYVKGAGIYAEFAKKMGQQGMAEQILERSYNFMKSINNESLQRVEGWNQKKDEFWLKQVPQMMELLNSQNNKIKNSEGILIEGRH